MEINDDIFFNDRQQQSGFLNWAHERIQKEINEIEFMEKEYGTAEWHLPDAQQGRPRATAEEKREVVAKVDKLRAEGYTYRLACECCDIYPGTYTKWKKLVTEGVKGTRPKRKSRDAGSTPATSTI